MIDVWEFAKQIEVEGKKYYEKLAQDSAIGELSGVFSFLASEEQHHWEIFDSMQNGLKTPELKQSDAIGDAKSAFEKLSRQFDMPEVIEDPETVYSKALDLEHKSIDLYQDALPKAETDEQKAAIEFIIQQEKKHARIVEAIMEFVRRPKEWLEDAEWYHLDKY
ncbi:MAG: ferritin family protein [Chitinivibrionales bacterium]